MAPPAKAVRVVKAKNPKRSKKTRRKELGHGHVHVQYTHGLDDKDFKGSVWIGFFYWLFNLVLVFRGIFFNFIFKILFSKGFLKRVLGFPQQKKNMLILLGPWFDQIFLTDF